MVVIMVCYSCLKEKELCQDGYCEDCHVTYGWDECRSGDYNKRIIRSHDNGWVLCKNNITSRPEVIDVALAAVEALELDFAAVDILWSDEHGPTVLECNTAPGMDGSTVTAYANEFRRIYNERV